MPRKARRKSRTNIYHVILRGINRQCIFEDRGDYQKFLSILQECKKISGFKLYAYCLMSNHVHLLLETGDEPLELIFRRIGSRYVYWYNAKYQRTGHLFQDRFRSEAVESTAYFLKAMRYILQNPMKAGIEPEPGTYAWTSYSSYTKAEIPDYITDTDFAMELFGTSDELVQFLGQKNEDSCLEITERLHGMTDEHAKEIMRRITGCSSVADFQRYDILLQKEYVKKMRGKGLSLGQIARITGMSKATVFRTVESNKSHSTS